MSSVGVECDCVYKVRAACVQDHRMVLLNCQHCSIILRAVTHCYSSTTWYAIVSFEVSMNKVFRFARAAQSALKTRYLILNVACALPYVFGAYFRSDPSYVTSLRRPGKQSTSKKCSLIATRSLSWDFRMRVRSRLQDSAQLKSVLCQLATCCAQLNLTRSRRRGGETADECSL